MVAEWWHRRTLKLRIAEMNKNPNIGESVNSCSVDLLNRQAAPGAMQTCTYCGRTSDDAAAKCSECGTELKPASVRVTRPPVLYSKTELLDIATGQKAVIWLMLLSIAAYAAAFVMPYIPLIVGIISLMFIYRLAVSLKEPAPWQYVVLGIIPCAGVIALLVINSRATSVLRARGIRVGLMGARRDDLDKVSSNST